MGVKDIEYMTMICFDPALPWYQRMAICDSIRAGLVKIDGELDRCIEAGCTSCCGVNFIPTVSELASVPECCP